MYEPLKDTKKLIEKLKKVCTAMSKYNLNSPCLLQMIRINGTYEFITIRKMATISIIIKFLAL